MVEKTFIPNNTIEESRIVVPDITEETVVDEEQVVEEECVLCAKTQHKCTICGKKVCNFHSQPDPNSSNEMVRVHQENDPRCKSKQFESLQFECPICSSTFHHQSELGMHMSNHAEPSPMQSLISNADDSTWKYVLCTECDGQFDNEMDMNYHKQRVHEFGETCSMYPCEECGFQGTDRLKLKEHVDEYHRRNYYNKRIKQNLKNINFEEESEDEVKNEWNPRKKE